MDCISLAAMEFYGFHGVLPEEAALGQRFCIDLDLFADLAPAGVNDDLAASVNYVEVYGVVKAVIEGERFRLIEALAERVAVEVLQQFPRVASLRVKVAKPQAPIAGVFGSVSVTLERARQSA